MSRSTFHRVADCQAPTPTLRFDVIDERAEQLGLNRGQLADRVGVDDSTMWRYRRGYMQPTLPVLTRLRDVLGVSIDAITGADGHDMGAAQAEEAG